MVGQLLARVQLARIGTHCERQADAFGGDTGTATRCWGILGPAGLCKTRIRTLIFGRIVFRKWFLKSQECNRVEGSREAQIETLGTSGGC